jgi:hypothetical protein
MREISSSTSIMHFEPAKVLGLEVCKTQHDRVREIGRGQSWAGIVKG